LVLFFLIFPILCSIAFFIFQLQYSPHVLEEKGKSAHPIKALFANKTTVVVVFLVQRARVMRLN